MTRAKRAATAQTPLASDVWEGPLKKILALTPSVASFSGSTSAGSSTASVVLKAHDQPDPIKTEPVSEQGQALETGSTILPGAKEALTASNPVAREPGSKKEQRAAWMRFHRSRQSSTGTRAGRSEKCPVHILKTMDENPLKVHQYFDLWAGSSESWGKVVLWEEQFKRDTESSALKEAWLTKAQLLEIYKVEAVVEGIITKKVGPDLQRAHPEAPEIEEAKQYLCVVEASKLAQTDKVHQHGLSFKGELDKESAKTAVPKVLESLVKESGLTTAQAVQKNAEEKAKEEKKQKALLAKQEKDAKRRSDPHEMAKDWLAGIGKDIHKASAAAKEATDADFSDKEVQNQFIAKFNGHITKLGKLREDIEGKSTNGGLHMDTVTSAQDVVASLRTDLKAWTKMQDLYSNTPREKKAKHSAK